MATEQRIMHTYRVEVLDAGTVLKSADVNLSFRLDAALNPVTENGNPVGEITAMAELVARLRKLSRARRIEITPAELDERDWSPRLVRQRFVLVDVDGNGRALPRKEVAR